MPRFAGRVPDLVVGGTSTLRGTVRSEKDKPVSNARIALVNSGRVALTDSLGAFFMGEAPAGSQTLEVGALGFAPDMRTLSLEAGSDTTLDLLAELDFVVRPDELEGLEVYRSTNAPPQFGDFGNGCGSIVIWTRPARRTK